MGGIEGQGLVIDCTTKRITYEPAPEAPRPDPAQEAELRRQQALSRLKLRALDDEMLADLLIVLGAG